MRARRRVRRGPSRQAPDRRGGAPRGTSGAASSSARRSAIRAGYALSRSSSLPHVGRVVAGQAVPGERLEFLAGVGRQARHGLRAGSEQRASRPLSAPRPRPPSPAARRGRPIPSAVGCAGAARGRRPANSDSLQRPQRDHGLVEERRGASTGRRSRWAGRSGPKSTARTCFRRSRLRRTGERFTCTRLAPFDGISISTRARPSRVSNSPRTYAAAAPSRTSGWFVDVRGDDSENRKYMPSSRFVLPSPFGPDRDDQPVGHGVDAGQRVVTEVTQLKPGEAHRGEALRRRASTTPLRAAAPASRGR